MGEVRMKTILTLTFLASLQLVLAGPEPQRRYSSVPTPAPAQQTSCLVCGFKLASPITKCINDFGVSKKTLICIKDAALKKGLRNCLPCVCELVKKINKKLGDLCCELSGCGQKPKDKDLVELGTSLRH